MKDELDFDSAGAEQPAPLEATYTEDEIRTVG